jgi:phospholipase A1
LCTSPNGRGTNVLTRSWNRVYANFILERGNFVLSVRPWLVLDDDENPDITEYLGYGELRGIYKFKEQQFSVMLRNNLRASENRGAIEAAWSFPLTKLLRGYAQYFYGYGESLLDYDYQNQRMGIGVMLNDWL